MSAGAVALEPLWDVKEVMRLLCVKKSWVYQRVESGELPHIRLGGHIRFDPSAIVAYVEACKARPARVLSIHRDSRSE